MKELKNKIAKYIYWRKKANTFENKYQSEVLKNANVKEELEETKNRLINLYEKRQESEKSIKDLKERVANLEIALNSKKEKKIINGKEKDKTTKSRRDRDKSVTSK